MDIGDCWEQGLFGWSRYVSCCAVFMQAYYDNVLPPPEIKGSSHTWYVQVLRSPKEAFAAAMQSWRERCEKCVCIQGDYVEK